MGRSGVLTEEASWQHQGRSHADDGARLDLVVDRADQCINLCEWKFTDDPFSIDKRNAAELDRKFRVFKSQSRTRTALLLTMVTWFGPIAIAMHKI